MTTPGIPDFFFTLDPLEFQFLLEFQTFFTHEHPGSVGIPRLFVGIVLEFQDFFFCQQPMEFQICIFVKPVLEFHLFCGEKLTVYRVG